MKKIFGFVVIGVMVLGLSACSGGGNTDTSDAAAVASLTDLPEVDSMVSGGSTAITDLNASMIKAVSGASGAPILREIDSTDAKTLFWKSGDTSLVDTVGSIDFSDGLSDEEQSDIDGFWRGEGSCRMAQMVGYSMQNLKQAGTSMCYLKNMPSAIGVSGIVPESGSAEIADPDATFDKQAGDIVMKVNVITGGDEGSQIVYIKVYGTDGLADDNDYNVDLWFCSSVDDETPMGFERIRYVDSTKLLTHSNVDTLWGTFQSTFTAKVKNDASGNPIFDTDEARAVETMFGGLMGDTPFVEKVQITVSGSQLIAKAYGNVPSLSQIRKNFAVAKYSGEDISDLRFLQAAYKGSDSGSWGSNEYSGGTEFQTDHYEPIASIDDLADAGIVAAANEVDLATDSYLTGDAPVEGDIDTASLADFSCNPTINYTIEMAFTDPNVAAVAALCENDFSNMDFCDSEAIQNARNWLFTGFGELL